MTSASFWAGYVAQDKVLHHEAKIAYRAMMRAIKAAKKAPVAHVADYLREAYREICAQREALRMYSAERTGALSSAEHSALDAMRMRNRQK